MILPDLKQFRGPFLSYEAQQTMDGFFFFSFGGENSLNSPPPPPHCGAPESFSYLPLAFFFFPLSFREGHFFLRSSSPLARLATQGPGVVLFCARPPPPATPFSFPRSLFLVSANAGTGFNETIGGFFFTPPQKIRWTSSPSRTAFPFPGPLFFFFFYAEILSPSGDIGPFDRGRDSRFFSPRSRFSPFFFYGIFVSPNARSSRI